MHDAISSLFSRTRIIVALAVGLIAMVFPAFSQASQITGIADENLEEWSPATWGAFQATGVKQVRHLVSWNVAEPGHTAELEEVERWVKAAEAHGLEVMISFNHPPLPCDRKAPTCEFPPADLAPSASAYLYAVGLFREKFPQISRYTAWDEPNHHVAPEKHPEQDMNPGSYPSLAAGYWVNLNFVCHLAKYGPNCDVAGGDFLEGTSSSGLESYMKAYEATLKESKVSPASWALHPYTAVENGLKEGKWGVIDTAFMPLTEGKPVWFTEVGGMVCKTDTGLVGGSYAAAEAAQNTSAQHLLELITHEGRVERTYYYAFSASNGGRQGCPDSEGHLHWDSELVANELTRPAYATLFPSAFHHASTTAFQANAGNLWSYSTAGPTMNTGLGLAPGTSPAIASGPWYPWTIAFHANGSNALWTRSWPGEGTVATNLGLAEGTSPSIATLPGGGYEVAFQANGGHLWTYSTVTGVGTDTLLGMAPGSSPSITALPGGGYRVAFRANGGNLWIYVSGGPATSTNIPLAEGSSPAIASVSGESYVVAFHSNTGALATYSSSNGGVFVTSLGMAASTSPSIAAVAGGGYQVAFQANGGSLWTYSTATGGALNTQLGMAAGSNPSITWIPGGYEVALQTNGHQLWTYSSVTGAATNTQLGMAAATSPSIAPE